MRLRVSSKITVIERSRNEYEYEGKKGVNYAVIAMQRDGENVGVENVSVTEDVFNRVSAMQDYHMVGFYDTKYKRFQFDNCEPVKPSTPSGK